MTFTKLNLHQKILQAIEACGYTKPTPVQAQAIPHILDGKDIVASAQTGTGKTAAYVLPGLQLLASKPSVGKPRILILAPTRELAGQITKVIGQYGKFMKVNIASFVGGTSYHRQFKELSRPIDIIIATPGRLMDHMENKRLDLSKIEMLVVDEADRMLDMGFINDIKTIVQATPPSRQTLLLSATADDKLISIMKNLLKNPVRINVSQDKIDATLIKQKVHVVADSNNKKQLLEHILDTENIFKAIIFSSTKRNAAKLALQLRDAGYAALPMHGDLKQSARNRTLAQFRQGEIQFLIATDVAARGIDVLDISHVINYDLPKFAEDYVHRIGRTGRAGKTGVAISMVLQSEIHQVRRIERYIATKIQQVRITRDGSEQEMESTIESEPHHTKRRRPKQKSGGYHSKRNDNPHALKSGARDSRGPRTPKFGSRDSSHNPRAPKLGTRDPRKQYGPKQGNSKNKFNKSNYHAKRDKV